MRVIYTHSYLWMYLRMMCEEMKYVSVIVREYFFKNFALHSFSFYG